MSEGQASQRTGSARPLVSVVIAVHNGENYLAQALESILAQDYEPFEVIVVDDGSEDGTSGVAQAFPGVRYVHQHNQGPAAARNHGIALARGELVAFVDHDDRVPPDKLRVQAGHLVENPEVGCVLGRQVIDMEPGKELPQWLQRDLVLNDLGGINFISAMVRSRVLDELGGFDPEYRTAEDRDLMVRMRAAGVKITVLDHVVLLRRIHHSNLSHENEHRTSPHPLLKSLRRTIEQRGTAAAPQEDSR